jgi:hypothetical protein
MSEFMADPLISSNFAPLDFEILKLPIVKTIVKLIGVAVPVLVLFLLRKKNNKDKYSVKGKSERILNRRTLIFIFAPFVGLIGLAVPVLFLLRKLPKKNMYSVKEKRERILNDKLPIVHSISITAICRNTKAVGEKIVLLRAKIKKTGEYIAMLDEHKQDSLAADMMNKQKEYYRYFVKYYDSYCSLYLGMRFQFYMEQIKTLSASKKKIHKLDIKQFTDTKREDMRSTVCILMNDALLDKYFANTAALPSMSNPLDFIVYDDNGIAIETGWAIEGKDDGIIRLEETAKQIETINGKIPQVTARLIALQSDTIIGGVSPVIEENILNKHKQENDFEEIIAYSEQLTDEYDRFAAEISLIKDLEK